MGENKRFVPVRGTEEHISAQALGFNDGYLYFATDSGRIYLDYTDNNGNKIARAMVGGMAGGAGNSGIYYASKTLTADEKLESFIVFPIDTIEGDDYPQKDDLIINISEGSFYRVTEPSPLTSSVTAKRLTISGGGGTSSLAEDIDLIVEPLQTVNLINGQSAKVYFTATSAKNAKGNEIDNIITISYTLAYTEDGINYTTYKTGSDQFPSGIRSEFEFGEIARLSSSSRLTLKATQQNADGSISRNITFTTSKLELTPDTNFSNIDVKESNNVILRCNAIGSMNKIVEYYFDDPNEPIYVENLRENDSENRTVNVQQVGQGKINLTHGNHEVWIRLYQSINGRKGIEVEPLHFEIAIRESGNSKPIIWLGEYKNSYFNYDIIQIPFRIYDPSSPTAATVHFKKDNKELDNSPQIITDNTKFSYFEIADAELDVLNRYAISCGEGDNEVSRDIEITVMQDPNRMDFGIQKSGDLVYMLNTVGSGRSNNESEIKRQTLIYKKANGNNIPARLSNFNWYNNGWIRGTDNKTCLRISNGAQLSIPIGQMKFAAENGSDTEIAHTIELQFKVRNIQNYSNLIHNITRYQNDADLFAEFYDDETHTYLTKYTNYDSFLAWYLKEINPTKDEPFTILDQGATEPRLLEYDDLSFDRIQKQIDLSNVFCGYYTGDTSSVVGMCLGPQDMFFSNGNDTVSASYVEDEIVSMSIVYQHGQTSAQKIIMIYINGSLTSVIRNTKGAFTIEADSIVFNSNACDIDLYKIRVYNTALNVNDIVMNYAADFENVDIYDQNKLAKSNDTINEYYFDYNEMLNYNMAHPNEPLMPYIIFDTTQTYPKDQQKLSYSKAVKRNVGVEFVNVPLELAYTSGELENLAKEDGLWKDGDSQDKKAEAVKIYYQHHCPSWKSTAGVNMAVQGTSSEFYPRRNYKLKTKTDYDDDGKSRVHIFLNRGPFAVDYEADQAGLGQNKYILSTTAFDNTKTYYSDENGTNEVTFDIDNPYKYNTYYIKNPDYVEFGKEKTRQDYWYMNNYTAGTTKFTMKIDYMESSGTYNMGFANLIKNGYSKHPLDDYNAAGAFQVEDPAKTSIEQATSYKNNKQYWYVNHKGNWKLADGIDGELNVDSAEAFAMTPAELWAVQQAGNDANKYATSGEYAGHWYEKIPGYSIFDIPNTDDYRTSVAGFRTLAFHKKLLQDGSIYYQYIGMYNMLLDKGSDEAYGFKPDKTTGVSPLQKYLKNKKISKIAECWEMENNNRTYCSFRDPDKRKDLTFKAFEIKNGQKVYKLNSVGSAPLVADSFEYRYHTDADILDYIMDPIKEADKYNSEDAQAYMTNNNKDLLFDGNNKATNFENRAEFLWDRYKNWEKACQWVWSTCTDYVISQGEYTITVVGNKLWTANTFYILQNNEYILDSGESWDAAITYYEPKIENGETSYVDAHAVDAEHLFNNENKNNFYIKVNNIYVSCANEPEFNDSATYYQLNNYTDEQLATKRVDRLVRQCVADETFDANEIYYTYDGTKQNGEATTKVDNLTAEQFAEDPTQYYVGITVTYKGKDYKYDTKEYRGDKFINELSKHFDIEYMATYFVMTEVFECYDSRGKNCMMASWGPQEENGDYIWYPIFYDIDTQLGVNNTGIPSFEYNVDATEDGNYSTSDSVLWNNFYRYFKSSAIISKYKHLKGVTSGVSWAALKNPPLQSVDYIEGWYNTDPEVVGQIVMRGKRPIVAQNLDEYYKYITITNGSNQQALQNGLIGHLSSDDQGNFAVDDGTYFYMLQGNRSLARRQFLTNRIEYIDSWLNQGNYQRGGFNRIRGRIAANNANKTSDKWVEPRDGSYYIDDEAKTKRHLFDAEYWLTLTPTHSSYVTLGDDNEAYPSQKYDGINPLRFEVSAIESGVRSSENYPEQLLYIYGVNNMSDLGDMSKLYWQEFSIEGSAAKLTSLKFGYDGRMEENGEMIEYHNNNVNNPSFGASKDSITGGLPLLKYMNISNVQLSQGSAVLDLTSCEKLENFRATGSNYSEIKFADGVALNTLYLPSGITSLKLTEARLLKNLITEYHYPELNIEGELEAEPGLYIQGLFENNTSPALSTLYLLGSGMGYDSYKLLKRYYDVRKTQTSTPTNIQMTKVQWSPYVQVSEDEEYDGDSYNYFVDNGHYGLEAYSYNLVNWPVKVANGEIYRIDKSINIDTDPNVNQITDVDMFYAFTADNDYFRTSPDDLNKVPNITGIIYVRNSTTVNEIDIRNNLQPKFPNLTFFFANVNQAYTAKFLLMDENEGNDGRYTLVGSQTITEGWFRNPIAEYGDISAMKPNHDFQGWALTNALDAELVMSMEQPENTVKWDALSLDNNVHTYYFYAICPDHKWVVKFYDGENLFDTLNIVHNTITSGPANIPYRSDENITVPEDAPEEFNNPIFWTNQFLGWNRNPNATEPINLSQFNIISDTTFYAIWNRQPGLVYNNIHPEWFEIVNENYHVGNEVGYEIKLIKKVQGKLTIPATINNKPVLAFGSINSGLSVPASSADSNFTDITHVFVGRNSNGTVNLRELKNNAFYRCRNLRYFDFNANGLKIIGAYAFQDCRNLIECNEIGGTITEIGRNAFITAINATSLNLIIGGNVTVLTAGCFQNLNQVQEMTLQIGTTDIPSSITNFNTAFAESTANKISHIIIYTSNRNAEVFNTFESLTSSLFGTSTHHLTEEDIEIIG